MAVVRSDLTPVVVHDETTVWHGRLGYIHTRNPTGPVTFIDAITGTGVPNMPPTSLRHYQPA